MADTDRIKRNLGKMIDQGAPESDLNGYLATEGFKSPDEWKAAIAPPAAGPIKTLGSSMALDQHPMSMPAQELPASKNAPAEAPPRSWSDVATNALKNAPDSAYNNFVKPFMHPVDTANAMVGLGKGLVSKAAAPFTDAALGVASMFDPKGAGEARDKLNGKRQQIEAPVDAVGKVYGDRYGSVEGFKNALADSPFDIVGDATMLGGGVGLAGKAPGLVGTTARAVGSASRAVDPVGLTVNAFKGAVEPIVSNVLGVTTGAGTDAVREAGKAGLTGSKAFTDNMRGNVPIENIVETAKDALDQIRKERGQEYRSGMTDISKDRSVLDFGDINKAVDKAGEVGSFKGANIAPTANAINEQLRGVVKDWETLNPKSALFKDVPAAELTAANFHTPEGLDALKRTLGDLRDATKYGTPERVAADRVYNAVRGEIASQAPAYAGIMEKYGSASEKLKEVTRTFSLGEKASGETASRKLTSAFRNNVQTGFGKRGEMLRELARHAPDLPAAVAGQSFNSLAPRGLVARGGALMAGGGGVASLGTGLLALPAFSPRIVGETAYMGGRAVSIPANALARAGVTGRRVGNALRTDYQAGRLQQEAQ